LAAVEANLPSNTHNSTGVPSDSELLCQVVQVDGLTPVDVIDADGTHSNGSCTDAATVYSAAAAGVRVVSEAKPQGFFGQFANLSVFTVRGRASATMQPFTSPNDDGPFLVCASRTEDGHEQTIQPPGSESFYSPGPPPSIDVAAAQRYWGLDPPNTQATDLILEDSSNSPKEHDPDVSCGYNASSFDGHGNSNNAGVTPDPTNGVETAYAGTGNGKGNVPSFLDVSGFSNVPSPVCPAGASETSNTVWPCYTVLPIIEPPPGTPPYDQCTSGNLNCQVAIIGLGVFWVNNTPTDPKVAPSVKAVARFVDIAKGNLIPTSNNMNCDNFGNGITCALKLRT
jgi:hypothetical protein